MKKSFGQFLVEKGAINEDQLLETLLEQAQKNASFVEIAWKEKILASRPLLECLEAQAHGRQDFITASKQVGVWTEDLEKKLWSILEQNQTPFTQLLVEKQLITMEQINQFLDSYIVECTQETTVAAASPLPSSDLPKSTESDFSEAVREFLVQFKEDSCTQIEACINQLPEQKDLDPTRELIHRLAGTAKLAKLKEMQKIFQIMEVVFYKIKSLEAPLANEQLSSLTTSLVTLFKTLQAIRGYIAVSGSEKDITLALAGDLKSSSQASVLLMNWVEALAKKEAA